VHTARGGNAAVAGAAAGCPWSCIASHIPALAHRRRVPTGWSCVVVREFIGGARERSSIL